MDSTMDSVESYNDPLEFSQDSIHDNRNTPQLSKEDIERLLDSSSDRITFVTKTGAVKSDAWKRFSGIYVDGKRVNYVSCKTCKSIYSYTSRSGTKSLNRHICSSPKSSKKRGMAKFQSPSLENYMLKKVPQHAKHELNKNITFGLAKDLRSLGTVEGEGFIYLAQSLVDFGAKYGSQRVADVIQHRTTLRNVYVPELCDKARDKYKTIFKSMPRNHKYAFSKDLWSEKYKKKQFLSLSCHFIDNDWELHSVMLGLDQMHEKKTTSYLRDRCKGILESYFDEPAEQIIDNSYSVTDGGSNMLSIFKHHQSCECHKINLFVSWTMNENKLPTQEQIQKRIEKRNPYGPIRLFNLQTKCPLIFATLHGVKSIVTYFKQTGLNAQLSKTLKQFTETRWDSNLELLESYDEVKDEVQILLWKNRQLDKIQNIDHDLLNEMIAFLRPIRKCSETLSGDKYPTFQLVAVCFHELNEKVNNFQPQSDEMIILHNQAKICFKKYVVTKDIHYVACMLDPRFRQLVFAENSDKHAAIRHLKRMVREQEEKDVDDDAQQKDRDVPSTSEASGSLGISQSKSHRFEQFQDVPIPMDADNVEMPEVERYLAQKFDFSKYTDAEGHFRILQFWKDMKDFPVLSKVARTLLAIPAAETTDERNFSSAGMILNPKRTQLSGESLCELLFIHKSVTLPI